MRRLIYMSQAYTTIEEMQLMLGSCDNLIVPSNI